MEKVIAVTVTFNSSKFLKRCIDSLNKQTYSLFRIIVVDNHSNEEHYKENIKLSSDNIDIEYLSENTGGAGGFEYGMRKALEFDPDWVWIMDDDAFPNADCLEKLLEKKEYENIGCICPVIFGVDLQEFQFYHHKIITKTLHKDTPAFEKYDSYPDVFEIDANAFVGPLVSRKAIEEVGVANGGLFIYGDDTEYTYRLSRRFKLIVVKDAIINHRDISVSSNGTINPKSWWKEYYMYRNQILFNIEFSKSPFVRKLANCLIFFKINKAILAAKIKKCYKPYSKIRIKLLKNAKTDGKNNKYGKTVDPSDYYKKIEDIIDSQSSKS